MNVVCGRSFRAERPLPRLGTSVNGVATPPSPPARLAHRLCGRSWLAEERQFPASLGAIPSSEATNGRATFQIDKDTFRRCKRHFCRRTNSLFLLVLLALVGQPAPGRHAANRLFVKAR